jgi:hypothetical protein
VASEQEKKLNNPNEHRRRQDNARQRQDKTTSDSTRLDMARQDKTTQQTNRQRRTDSTRLRDSMAAGKGQGLGIPTKIGVKGKRIVKVKGTVESMAWKKMGKNLTDHRHHHHRRNQPGWWNGQDETNTTQPETRQHKTRQDNTREYKPGQDETTRKTQDNARQDNTRYRTTHRTTHRQPKATQDKTSQYWHRNKEIYLEGERGSLKNVLGSFNSF